MNIMGTELLKEQYNILLNDQKNKLQKLKQKKLSGQQKKGNNDYQMTSSHLYEDDQNELDLDDEILSKFNKLDNDSDSDQEMLRNHKPVANNSKPVASKLLIKKNVSKKLEKPQQRNPFLENDDDDEQDSIENKLRELKDENGRFRKLLAEKEYEINYLKKKSENEQVIQGLGPISGDAAATKIVDLAKKVRELTSNLESEKTKNKMLAKSNKDLEYQAIKSREKKKEYFADDNDNSFSDDEQVEAKISLAKENKELKEKLNQTSHKMMEFKSQTECLKQDLKKTQKALEKEVGDSVDIKTILSGNGTWKGRQQQIRTQQNKIRELKEQIGMMDSRASQMLDDEDLDESNNFMKGPKSAQFSQYTFNSMSTTRTNADSRQKSELRKVEKEKREQLEKLKRDSEKMETDFNSLKEKMEASKSRNKVLANENKSFKEQIKVLVDKGQHDNELIDALMKKQGQLKKNFDSLVSEKEEASQKIENKSKESQIKSMQEKNTIEQLKAIITEREKKVKVLESELEVARQNIFPQPTEQNNQFFLNPSQSNNENSFYNDFDTESTRPPSTSNFQRNKPNSAFSERESFSRASLRSAKSNILRPPSSNGLNAKMIEQKKDLSKDYKLEISELNTLYKTSEIERVRLLELVKTLEKRIQELNDKLMDSENKLNEQRRRCANSEKQIEKLKIQEPKNAALSKQKSLVSQSTTTTTMDQYKIEELETSLLIQKDENDALKAALKSTLEAKEEDLRLYVEMLESTKRVFLDGLKQYKQTSSE